MINTYSPLANRVQARPSLRALIHDGDEWDRLVTAYGRAHKELNEVNAAAAIPDLNVLGEVQDALYAGTPLPKNFGARRAEAARLAAIRDEEIRTFTAAYRGFADALGNLAEESVPDIFEALDKTVRETTAAAAELLAGMPGTADPLTAIRNGLVDEWRELAGLYEQWATAREDHEFLLDFESPMERAPRHGHMLFRGLPNIWTDWRKSEVTTPRPGWSEFKTAPWPADTRGLDHFIWVAGHCDDAQPWAPTTEEADTARAKDLRQEPSYIPKMRVGGELIAEGRGEAAAIRRRAGTSAGAPGSVVWHGRERPS